MEHSASATSTLNTAGLLFSNVKRRRLRQTLPFFVVLIGWFGSASAQSESNVQHTNNRADQALRANVRVDPSTLGMSLSIPLASYPGRAGNDVPVTLNYNSKLWRIGYEYTVPGNLGTYTWTMAKYAESSTAGWTSSLEIPWIEYTGKYEFYDAAGNSVCQFCEEPSIYYVKRIHVHLPDGSAHELQNATDTVAAFESPLNFSGIFKAVDGSPLYFDTSTNTLYLPDGSRYLFSSSQEVSIHGKIGQPATTYIDRNGNTLTYDSSNRRWTDTVNRTLDNPIPNQAPAAGTEQTYTLPSFNGSALTYKLRWAYMQDVLRVPAALKYTGDTKCQAQPVQQLSPSLFASQVYFTYVCAKLAGGAPELFNPVVLKEIELPNTQKYQFKYNIYGEIEQVLLPTGGYERFQYAAFEPLSGPAAPYGQSNRGVSDRWISVDGVNEVSHFQYSATGCCTIRTTAPDGSYSERSLIQGSSSNYQYPFGFDPLNTGKASAERSYSAGGQMLRRKLTEWNGSGTLVTKEVSILLDTGGNALAATTTYQHDADQNVISTSRYDFASISASMGQTGAIGSIPNGPLVRTEETTFLVNDTSINSTIRQTYRDRNLVALPTSTRVKNASGTIVAQNEIKYDETGYAPLTCGAVYGWSDPGAAVRGMATTTRSWLNTNGSWLETHAQYDQCGSPRKSTDALGKVSEVTYSPTYHFAYPTTTTSADPDGGGPLTPLVSTTSYDLTTGLATFTIDANQVRTDFEYNDTFKRLTRTVSASGTAVQNQSAVSYDDVNRTVTTTSDLHVYGDNVLVSKVLYDGLGRTTETRSYEGGANYIVTQQQYDTLGRAFKKSNPFRPQSESAVWTTTGFDGLGREISVTTPDNAVVTTSYSGNAVTVTDQAGKKRKSVTDGLGRLKEVYEDPNGLNYLTSYSYDTLDNLITVNQASQTRTFAYDSLKRLTSATNPESGTIAYTYDSNGNLLTKTDARSVVSTYSYDALNRNTAVNYSDATPDIFRQYDLAPTNGKGRLNQSWQSGSITSATYVDEYDPMGRPLKQRQKFETNGVWSGDYQTQRRYNLAGGVKEQTYPSNRKVYYTYDDAGRSSSFTGELGDGVSRNYATGIQYSPWGLSREQFGTDIPLYHRQHYTNRGQLFDMRVATTDDGSWNRGAIINYYSLANWGFGNTGTDTNGNVYGQQHWVPHNDQMSAYTVHQQNYSYDSLNRISWAGEYLNGGTHTGAQVYLYDRWGNRKIDSATWGTGINNKQFDVNTANNRLVVPGGQSGVMGYDSAGNLTTDTYSGNGSRTYDAENRMTSAQGINQGNWQYYTYNADGQRVRRKIEGVETWQVYGMDGELLAEYAASGSATNPQKEYGYRNGQLLVTAEAATNVALTSSGATISASSTLVNPPYSYPVSAVNNGDRKGLNGGYGGNWAGSSASFPQWVQVDFNGSKTISEISVFSLQDNYANPQEPTEAMTFSLYGLTGFDVQYWNGSAWVTVPGGSVSGNNKVWKKISFAAITTTKMRVLINATVDSWSRMVELEAWTSASANINWLVADHLGTPRMIFDKTGERANVKRHDYLPFGEELYAGVSSRTVEHGYTGDGVRQKFTSKERDNETGLDYFAARYYASTQGRFTGADPYDINLERQNTSQPEEAENLFKDYIFQPQHWNRYVYAVNNPLRYVDPDGRKNVEYWINLLGKDIKITISDKFDPDTIDAIKKTIDSAVARINDAVDLTKEEVKAINKMKGIAVDPDKLVGMNRNSGMFQLTGHYVINTKSIDFLAGAILHDAFHMSQGEASNNREFLEREKKASTRALDVAKKIPLHKDVLDWLAEDAEKGHLDYRKGQKSRPPKKKTP